jgi:hypothetical protein
MIKPSVRRVLAGYVDTGTKQGFRQGLRRRKCNYACRGKASRPL